jgi:hypothetical protein
LTLGKQVAQMTVGSFGYLRFLGMGSTPIGAGTLIYAARLRATTAWTIRRHA